MAFLIVRPEYDYATRYISTWAEKVKVIAIKKKLKVLDLQKDRAIREQVEGMLKKHEPSLVFLNGHGDSMSILGQDKSFIIKMDVNDNLLRLKIIYALSCSSGSKLGQASVQKGALAYIGYNDEFALLHQDDKRTQPQDDKIAQLFLDPSNIVVISLLKGHTVEESFLNSLEAFKRNILDLLTSAATPLETASIPYLWWNLNILCFSGDGKAKL